jgi:hypothetical protein
MFTNANTTKGGRPVAEENWRQKVTWSVIGAIVSGVIGLGVTYVTGVLTPKAQLQAAVSGPWPEHAFQPGTWDRIFILLRNVSKSATAKDVSIRIVVTSPPVAYEPTNFKQFFRMVADKLCKLEDERESYDYKFGEHPLTMQAHVLVVLCSAIYPGEERQFEAHFAPPANQTDDAPNQPSEVFVSAKYKGYEYEAVFNPKGGDPCRVSRKYSGRWSEEECYTIVHADKHD